jgi:hypothetical protein
MKTRVVLFDVGGVLVELGGVDALLGWLGSNTTVEQLWPVWLRSPAVRAFETGRIEPLAFAQELILELQLRIPPETFLHPSPAGRPGPIRVRSSWWPAFQQPTSGRCSPTAIVCTGRG